MNKQCSNTLNYRVVGKGHPVIFLHGFLESSTMWDYLVFPDNWMRVYVDLPGHGESEFTDANYSMHNVAKEVLNLIDNLGINSFDIIGHSMGGYVGLEMKKQSDHCGKLVLLNSNFWSDSTQKKVDRNRVAKVVLRNKNVFLYEAIPNLFLDPIKFDEQVKYVLKEALRIDAQTIAQTSIAMSKRKDFAQYVKENKNDIFIIQGKEDPIVSSLKMYKMAKQYGLQIEMIQECGHMGHIESPDRVSDLLKEIMDKKNGNY